MNRFLGGMLVIAGLYLMGVVLIAAASYEIFDKRLISEIFGGFTILFSIVLFGGGVYIIGEPNERD